MWRFLGGVGKSAVDKSAVGRWQEDSLEAALQVPKRERLFTYAGRVEGELLVSNDSFVTFFIKRDHFHYWRDELTIEHFGFKEI